MSLQAPRSRKRRVALAALAGLWGGALAGLLDAAFTSLRLGDQISAGRHLQLAGVGLALGAWLGMALAVLAGLLAWFVPKLLGKRGGVAPAVWPTLLAAPLIFDGAFSVFSGPQAARIPGNFWLSCLLFVIGCAVVAWAGLQISAVLLGHEAGSPVGRPAALLPWLLLLSLVGVGWANANLFPRLYPWFHRSLAWWALGMAVVAARLLLRAPVRWRAWVMASVLVLAAPSASAFFSLRKARQVRFALFDKSAALAVYASYLPLPKPVARPLPVAAVGDDNTALSPLPDGPKRPDADVVLITIDALRHDHVGAYGYARPTTPNLDRLAGEGTRFVRAYTQAPHTSFAVTSMLTGKYYPTLLRLTQSDQGEPITLLLRRYGWKTAAFFPPAVFFVDGDKLASFRDSHYQFEYVKCEFLEAQARVDQITSYFETVAPERAFVWVHFFEPHEPYETHTGFGFGKRDKDRYDSEVAYTDAAVGKLLDYLAKHRPNAIVILSADHGEEFDEHGGRYHGSSLYDEQVRVPLIVRVPDLSPRVVQGQVELVDLAPTILALVDIPVPARMRGTDLGPWLSGAQPTRLPPAFAEVESKRMVVYGEEKLICDSEASACELFDLAQDPREQQNLTDDAPDRAARLRARMDRWLDAQGSLESLSVGDEGAGLPKAIERGRLGDAEVAADLLRLAEVPGDLSLRIEAARLLALLPAQPGLKAELMEAWAQTKAHAPDVAHWLAVAATAAGADVGEAMFAVLAQGEGTGTQGLAVDAGEANLVAVPELQLLAALVLAEQGQQHGVPVLLASLAQCNGTPLCRRTVRALGDLGNPEVAPALHNLMDDSNARLEVVRALGSLRAPSSLLVLVQALREDQRVPVRAEAALSLAKLGGTRARAALREAQRREREAPVLEAIKQGMASLAGRPSRH